MSKNVEQKALEAYPMDEYEFDKAKKSNIERSRYAYIKGYNQATQDFLEKAEMYLKTRVYYNMHPNNVTTAIQEFKNYMQNESEN